MSTSEEMTAIQRKSIEQRIEALENAVWELAINPGTPHAGGAKARDLLLETRGNRCSPKTTSGESTY